LLVSLESAPKVSACKVLNSDGPELSLPESGAPFRHTHLRQAAGLTLKYKARLGRLTRVKHYGLLSLIISDKEKTFFNIDT
jgi:hypothetical protein